MKFRSLHVFSIVFVICLFTTACNKDHKTHLAERSIVILYENDVHCAIDDYATLAGWRDAIVSADTAWVATVSVGDFLQGNTVGAISRGQYIVDIMSRVGYDAIALGNHEFDFGIDRMTELLAQIHSPIVCANYFVGDAITPFYAPYIIRQYGKQRVAFVGVLTPQTLESESYAFYDDANQQLADLRRDDFYSVVQQAIDNARNDGADYVVLLAHVGDITQSYGFNSTLLVNKTRGIDVVLDGHSHSVVETLRVPNIDGDSVLITQTGTEFAYIGKLVISPNGNLYTTLTPTNQLSYKSPTVLTTIDSVNRLMRTVRGTIVATSTFKLKAKDEEGKWLVRNSETNLGDLIADAYRHEMNADIAFENGGGIRNNIESYSISYADVISVLPFNNTLCKIEATGRQILNMLSTCCANTPTMDGSFPQCSAIRYTINTSTHTIHDVEVRQANGSFSAIDSNAIYTVALTNYNYTGGGFYGTLKQCNLVGRTYTFYYDAVANYLKYTLNGVIPEQYATPQGRITIVSDN